MLRDFSCSRTEQMRCLCLMIDGWRNLCDIRLPGMDGQRFLSEVRQIDSDLSVILITGHGDIAMAVEAMRKGAYDFIEKPFTANRLVDIVQRALDKRRLVLENRNLKNELEAQDILGPRIIGKTPVIQALRSAVNQLADTDTDILLMGETGTGAIIARIAGAISRATGFERNHKNRFSRYSSE